jgi:hypothetical protein
MNMAFEFGKIYEVTSEWKQYFDSFGDNCLGYYYVTLANTKESGNIQTCVAVNKNKEVHPAFPYGIPFNFSDCKPCSLPSTAKLKLFRIVNKSYPSSYEIEEAIVIETDEEAAYKLDIDDLPKSAEKEVEYIGDYFGALKAGSVILSTIKPYY